MKLFTDTRGEGVEVGAKENRYWSREGQDKAADPGSRKQPAL